MAADNTEAAPNKNSGADAIAFDSPLLGGGDITDEEGAALKENPPMSVAVPHSVRRALQS